MSQRQHKPMTAMDYLAWEDRQETRWEFDGCQPVAMNGGTHAHTWIQGGIIIALRSRLRGKPCRPCGPEMRVPTLPGRYRYPDALVTCAPLALDARDVPEPCTIFEVLSPSTALDDRTTKLAEYQSIPSLRSYVMLEQLRMFATVIGRSGSGWSLALAGPDGTIALPELGLEIPVAELYEGLDLPPSGDSA